MPDAFITSGTPCDRCFIPMDNAERDKPTVIETIDGQITAHWDCLPVHVQAQVEANQRKATAQWN